MKRVLVLLLAMSVGVTASAAIGAKADDASVRRAVKDYLEGWFSTHPDCVVRAVRSSLLKCSVQQVPGSSEEYPDVMTSGSLVSWARHDGPRVKDTDGFQGIGILYQNKRIAVVRAESEGFCNVCTFVKLDGNLKILVALWD